MTEEKKQGEAVIMAVYVGIRLTTKDQRRHVWYEVPEDSNDGQKLDDLMQPPNGLKETRFVKLKPAKYSKPGQVYRITTKNNNGTWYLPSISDFQGWWENQEDVTRWQVEHTAANVDAARNSKMRKEMTRNFDYERLKPFHDAYRLASPAQQSIILAHIIRYITRGAKGV